MADHVRKQIRDAIGATVTGLATTGANVFTQSRVRVLADSDLPALLVYLPDEQLTPITNNPGTTIDRTVQVVIEGVTKDLDALEDELDQIANEVEVAMSWPAGNLSDFARTAWLRRVQTMVAHGDLPTGRILMTYEVNYFTADGAPDVAT